MNWLLIMVCIILIWNAVQGYRRGLLGELYGFIATILALILAIVLVVTAGIEQGWGIFANVILFAAGFILIRYLLGLVNGLVMKATHIPVLGLINRLLGVCIGLIYGMLLIYAIFLLLNLIADTAVGISAASCIAESEFLTVLSSRNILWHFAASLLY